jgi:hypothetical protein
VLFRGYIDESYGPKLFTLSCLMSDPPTWRKIETSWKKRLRAKNSELVMQKRRPLTRYHAADCSSRVNEFEGWSVEEQIEFTKKLLKIVEGRFLNVIAYSVPIDALTEVFPEHAKDPIGPCYGLLLKMLMTEFTSQVEDAAKKLGRIQAVKLTLFHERCSYDSDLLRAFNSAMDDPTFRGKQLFSTVSPVGWEDCIPLQLADLLAYENFKDAGRRDSGRKRRKSLELLLAGNLGGRSRTFKPEALVKMRQLMSERFGDALPTVSTP